MAEQDDGQTASTDVKDGSNDATQGQARDTTNAVAGRAPICHASPDTHQKACCDQNNDVLAGVGLKWAIERLQKDWQEKNADQKGEALSCRVPARAVDQSSENATCPQDPAIGQEVNDEN